MKVNPIQKIMHYPQVCSHLKASTYHQEKCIFITRYITLRRYHQNVLFPRILILTLKWPVMSCKFGGLSKIWDSYDEIIRH